MSSKAKKTLSVLAILLCICSIIYGIYISDNNEPLKGTYYNGMDVDATYLVFEKEGTYLLYQQDRIIDKGEYYPTDADYKTYKLKSEKVEKLYEVTVDKETITIVGIEGTDKIDMKKIDDIPIYINI